MAWGKGALKNIINPEKSVSHGLNSDQYHW